MANEEQLSILKQGVDFWNKWRDENPKTRIDLSGIDMAEANFERINLRRANLSEISLRKAHLSNADLTRANLNSADLRSTDFSEADLSEADLTLANLSEASLAKSDLTGAIFTGGNLSGVDLFGATLYATNLSKCNLKGAELGFTLIGEVDLSNSTGLQEVRHSGPSVIGLNTIRLSKGKIPASFLRGCGLGDWEIESTKLYNPELSNDEIDDALYKVHDIRAKRPLQISSLFISYSHGDGQFVDKMEEFLNRQGIRFWRDIHDMKSGRMEKQIDRAIRLNPNVLLILSKVSLQSDWVEHEVRTARALEKEMKRDILCPVALDDSWKKSPWAKRIMEQITEYNILDFSEWKNDAKFGTTFNKLIDGLELFYK